MNHYYNLSESARELGCTAGQLSWAIENNFVPAPDIVKGKRVFYSPKRLAKVKARLSQGSEGYSFKQAAEYLGISYSAFRHKIEMGHIPIPSRMVGKRYKFSQQELEALATDDSWRQIRQKRTVDGYYNCCQAAEYLRMPRITLQSWIAKGSIPPPSHRVRGIGWPLYSRNDLENIRAIFPNYFAGK